MTDQPGLLVLQCLVGPLNVQQSSHTIGFLGDEIAEHFRILLAEWESSLTHSTASRSIKDREDSEIGWVPGNLLGISSAFRSQKKSPCSLAFHDGIEQASVSAGRR